MEVDARIAKVLKSFEEWIDDYVDALLRGDPPPLKPTMKVVVERAVGGPKLVEEWLSYDEAVELVGKIYFGYRKIYEAGYAKACCQVQVRNADDKVLYRAGAI